MKYPAISLVLLLSATAAGSAQRAGPPYQQFLSYAVQQPAGSATPPSALDLVSGYRDAAAKLPNSTKVPLRLPTWVPYDDDKDNPVFASVASATANGYQVELAWVPDCGGGRGLPPGIHQRQQLATRGKQGTEDSGHLKRRHSGIFHRRGLRCELRRLRGLLDRGRQPLLDQHEGRDKGDAGQDGELGAGH